MKNKIALAIVHELCPICGKPMNEHIIINTKAGCKKAKEIEELNNKAVGFSKDACEECSKYKDEAIFIIAINEKLSDNKDLHRTGQIVGIKKDADIVSNFKVILSTDNGVKFIFMEEEVGKKIEIFK